MAASAHESLRKPPATAFGQDGALARSAVGFSAIAPSGPAERSRVEHGIESVASRLGIQVVATPDLWPSPAKTARSAAGGSADISEAFSEHYLSGSRATRIRAFAIAYANGPCWAMRGGYGSMHLLPHLDFSGAPQLLVGFSDVTAIGCALLNARVPWVHGPLLTTISDESNESCHHLSRVLSGRLRGEALRGETLVTGTAEGPLVGGSLSLLAALSGTRFFPNLSGAILCLEDVGEQPYRLDRLWTQLELSGALASIAGLVLGQFSACEPKSGDYTAQEVLNRLAQRAGVPTLIQLPFGHISPNFALPMGALARIEGGALWFLEEVVDGPV